MPAVPAFGAAAFAGGDPARVGRTAAHLVVARNLGSDSLARWLVDRGHHVTRRSSRRGYRLLDVGARPPGPTT